ncbi:helix-turn-helix domain-containing protein [Pseudoduganella sp. S-14]|uniref:helix-turn-helix domain-containing protein n=1 Tax=Pseudoduganella sp. S-14 TaxID=3404065 RepID=UPI003CEF0C01
MVQRLRVEQTKQFLAGRRWSVGRVTEEVGYLDQASFTRLFTRLVGMPPAQYRQQMRMASRY